MVVSMKMTVLNSYSLIQDAHFTLMMQAVTMSEMLVNF